MQKANFSHLEALTTLEYILENKDLILYKDIYCSDLSNQEQSNVWKKIKENVSSLGTVTVRQLGNVQ